jgi:hypothetical protein
MLDNEWIAWEEGGIFASLFPWPSFPFQNDATSFNPTLFQKLETYIPGNETARLVSDLFIPTVSTRQTDRENI